MRVLKFRAWDIKEKRFLFPYPEGFNIIGECTINDCLNQHIKNNFIERLNDIKIMQYVGLEDKNGKEIYEGDIVKSGDTVHIYQIKWINSHSKYEGIIKSGLFFLNGYLFEKSEIIGNIYENPELLERE